MGVAWSDYPLPEDHMSAHLVTPAPGWVRSWAPGYRGAMATADRADTVDDDRALGASFAAGVDGSMRRVWDRYGALVHTYCIRSLSDRDAAADCTQETFVSAWRSRDRYDATRGGLAGWLLGIARHRVHDAYRSQARTAVPRDGDDDATAASVPPESDELVERLLVADVLSNLPDRPRRILELAFFSGLSQREIAERTAQPLGTVKSDMRRALLRLRSILEAGDLRA